MFHQPLPPINFNSQFWDDHSDYAPKTNMTQPFEDVLPIQHGDFGAMLVYWRVPDFVKNHVCLLGSFRCLPAFRMALPGFENPASFRGSHGASSNKLQ